MQAFQKTGLKNKPVQLASNDAAYKGQWYVQKAS